MSSSVSFARDSAEPPTVPSNTSRFFSCATHRYVSILFYKGSWPTDCKTMKSTVVSCLRHKTSHSALKHQPILLLHRALIC